MFWVQTKTVSLTLVLSGQGKDCGWCLLRLCKVFDTVSYSLLLGKLATNVQFTA